MTGKPPKKLPWFLLGVGAAAGVDVLIALTVVVVSFTQSGHDVRTMAAPQAIRLSEVRRGRWAPASRNAPRFPAPRPTTPRSSPSSR